MTQLPSVSGMKVRRVFEKNGWVFKRQKGSHMILTRTGFRATLSVPNHKSLKEPLLKRLIKDSGMTVEQFKEML
ncbi:MAG: type II toxin-antitoxin system HicA family toxin [Deltaproteobacteria bacterium]|nr:type II toxin-antitoxin system HicA family toxin [Deltaproteobacteria bacterium]